MPSQPDTFNCGIYCIRYLTFLHQNITTVFTPTNIKNSFRYLENVSDFFLDKPSLKGWRKAAGSMLQRLLDENNNITETATSYPELLSNPLDGTADNEWELEGYQFPDLKLRTITQRHAKRAKLISGYRSMEASVENAAKGGLDPTNQDPPIIDLSTAGQEEIVEILETYAKADSIHDADQLPLRRDQGVTNSCVTIAIILSSLVCFTNDKASDENNVDEYIQTITGSAITMSMDFHECLPQVLGDIELNEVVMIMKNICGDRYPPEKEIKHLLMFHHHQLESLLSQFEENKGKDCSLVILHGGHAFVMIKFALNEDIYCIDTKSPAYYRKLNDWRQAKTHLIFKALTKVSIFREGSHWHEEDANNNCRVLQQFNCLFLVGPTDVQDRITSGDLCGGISNYVEKMKWQTQASENSHSSNCEEQQKGIPATVNLSSVEDAGNNTVEGRSLEQDGKIISQAEDDGGVLPPTWTQFRCLSNSLKSLMNRQPSKKKKRITTKKTEGPVEKISNSFPEFQQKRISDFQTFRNSPSNTEISGGMIVFNSQNSHDDNDQAETSKLPFVTASMRDISQEVRKKQDTSEEDLYISYSTLDSALDYGIHADIKLACFAQASTQVLHFPLLGSSMVMRHLVLSLLNEDQEKSSSYSENNQEKSYLENINFPESLEILMVVHGSQQISNGMVENILQTEGSIGFFQEYNVVGYCLFSLVRHCMNSMNTKDGQGNGCNMDASYLVYKEESPDRNYQPNYVGCGDVRGFLDRMISAYSSSFQAESRNPSQIYHIDICSHVKETTSCDDHRGKYNQDGCSLKSNNTHLMDDVFIFALQLSSYLVGLDRVGHDFGEDDFFLSGKPFGSSRSAERPSAFDTIHDILKVRHHPGLEEIKWAQSVSYEYLKKPSHNHLFNTKSIMSECHIDGGPDICINIGAIFKNIHESVDLQKSGFHKYSQILEQVCVSSMFIYSLNEKFRIGCSCCNQPTHVSGSGDYDTVSDALQEVCFVSYMHRLVHPLKHDEERDQDTLEAAILQVKEFPYRIYEGAFYAPSSPGTHPHANIKPCQPDRTKIDSCIGNDQVMLSALLHEKDLAGKVHHHKRAQLWGDMIESLFVVGHHEEHDLLQVNYKKVLAGEDITKIMTQTSDGSITIEERDGSYDSPENHLEQKLLLHIEKIIKIDWLDTSFPTKVPTDYSRIQGKDRKLMNDILSDEENSMNYFQQTGLLESYLNDVRQDSNEASVYRSIPKIASLHAFECSNKCVNIFNKDGRSHVVDNEIFVFESSIPMDKLDNDEVKMFMQDPKMSYKEKDRIATVEWIPGGAIIGFHCSVMDKLEGFDEFRRTLEHANWVNFPLCFSNDAKTTISNPIDCYSPNYFLLESLIPYQVKMTEIQPSIQVQLNATLGLAKTIFCLDQAFVMGTAPYQKAMEYLTNVCWQHTQEIVKVLKREEPNQLNSLPPMTPIKKKAASNERTDEQPEGSIQKKQKVSHVGEIRKKQKVTHDREIRVSARLCAQKNKWNRAAYFQAERQEARVLRVSSRLFAMMEELRKSNPIPTAVRTGKAGCRIAKKGFGHPPPIEGSPKLPVQITTVKWNCAIGNTMNLLHCVGQCVPNIESALCTLAQMKRCHTSDIFQHIGSFFNDSGYEVEKLPASMGYEELTKKAMSHSGPILVSLPLDSFQHVIGICPHLLGLQIVDGCHPSLQPMPYSKDNLSWCCGDGLLFTKIASGFTLSPGKKLRKKIMKLREPCKGFST